MKRRDSDWWIRMRRDSDEEAEAEACVDSVYSDYLDIWW